jgi:16S rRNA (guanine(966)-N(2))-methyltransferase RsmD
MFSAIQFEIAGRAVLDAFAGSGQLGIEALSRGAVSCVFLESDRRAGEMVQKNCQRAKVADKFKLISADALQYMRRCTDTFGLIFLDPPYGKGILQEAIPIAAERLEAGGLLVCEAPAKESLPDRHGDVALRKEYRHGKTKLCVFQKGIE